MHGIEAVQTAEDALIRVAQGDVAVIVVPRRLPAAIADPLRLALADLDPLCVIIDAEIDAQDGGLAQAIEWALNRSRDVSDAATRRLGGSPAGEFACRGRDELVGAGEAMSGFRTRLRQVAEHDAATLIHGPCGTPLEAAARWLHVSSVRGGGPCVPVDCREGTESQLLLRLFGHVRDAFPGATEAGIPAVGLAAGGTLMLDGIEHAPHAVQERIIELITQGRWQAVGGSHHCTSHARIVLTVRQSPMQAVLEKRLASSLMDVVSSHVIRMPTLADRREDIPDLARHYLTHAALRLGQVRPDVQAEVLEVLTQARWRGHDRELELVCERLVLHASAGRVDADEVRAWTQPAIGDQGAARLVCEGSRKLEDIERTAILATLRHHKGHRRRSAAALGIGVRTLGLKLRRWKDAEIVPDTI